MIGRWMLIEYRMMWQFEWQLMSSVSEECGLSPDENEIDWQFSPKDVVRDPMQPYKN